MKDKTIELTADLNGLNSLEATEELLWSLEDLIEAELPARGIGHEKIQKIGYMRRAIMDGGCGYKMEVTVAIESADAAEAE